MPDKKLTDAEIVKALEYCVSKGYPQGCDECPYRGLDCNEKLDANALDLINRLQAEKERLQSMNQAKLDMIHDLQAEIERLNTYLDVIGYSTDKIKAEAYKEFADKIYEKVGFYITETNDTLNKMLLGEMQGTSKRKHYLYGGLSVLYEINSMLNNALKELVGD